jgi:epoxyqueuosine reductase
MRKRLYLFILSCWIAAVFALLWFPQAINYVPETVKKFTLYDKAAHFVFFGVMAYLFLVIGIRWRKYNFLSIAVFSAVIVTLINILGEYIQGFIPGRVPSYLDFAAGLIGTLFVIPVVYMMHHSPRRRLLLHVCCAPCATAVREILASGYKLEFYFYNPNIHPEKEYQKRLNEVKKLARRFGIKLKIGKYDRDSWLKAVAGHEQDAEGGNRCELCFRHRLEETALAALRGGYKNFTTTLSVSPHKDLPTISRIGGMIGQLSGLEFLNKDFKEDNGWRRSLELSKDFGFYRQKYCGCEFSNKKS